MKRQIVYIPTLCPTPSQNPASLGSYMSSQPIIQWKELVLDQQRYDEYKAWIARPVKKREEATV